MQSLLSKELFILSPCPVHPVIHARRPVQPTEQYHDRSHHRVQHAIEACRISGLRSIGGNMQHTISVAREFTALVTMRMQVTCMMQIKHTRVDGLRADVPVPTRNEF